MYGLVVVICCGIAETHSGAEAVWDSCHWRRGRRDVEECLRRSKQKGSGFAEDAMVRVWEVATSLAEMCKTRSEEDWRYSLFNHHE